MTPFLALDNLSAELTQKAHEQIGVVEAHAARTRSLQHEVSTLEDESALLGVTAATLDRLIQMLTAESVGKVEALVTHGLKTVFPNQDLRFRFEVTTKFRGPWLEPRLIDGGIDQPILDAFGGGPATLVAFILRIVVVSRMKLAPLILLDEPFTMVSVEYRDHVGALIRDLCKSLGLTIVMVTHLTEFSKFADHAYRIEGDPHGPHGSQFVRVDPRSDPASH